MESTTTTIDVRPQHTIPLGKAFSLCFKGIAHRLLRSLLTLTVIVLAVAFFMSLLCEGAFTRSVGEGIDDENAIARFAQRRTAVWFDVVDPGGMAGRLAGARPADLAEIAAVAHAQPERVGTLAAEAAREARILGFFEGMDAGSRAILVRKAKGADTFAALAPPAAWDEFTTSLKHLHALKPPLPLGEFRAAVERHPGFSADAAVLAAAWRESLAGLRQDMADQLQAPDREAANALLIAGEPGKMADFQRLLAARGFTDSVDDVARVHRAQARIEEVREINEALSADAARSAWKQKFFEEPKINEKMLHLGDQRVVEILGGRWSRDELAGVSRELFEDTRRLEVERAVDARLPTRLQPQGLISGRQAFLMAISFVVCMVGITNAMLMAITERFREIATMKCLGATDGFILNQFLMEAAFQGLAGGVAGMLIGGALSIAKCSVVFGVYLFACFPALSVLAAGGICVLTGVLLSTLASIYPSWMASRMAPMDAMRIE